jgi:endonuclease/exonuclease/phosphatase family metal-dependent hydrolase
MSPLKQNTNLSSNESITKISRVRILSYNIQTGLPGISLRDSIATSWRHILPSEARTRNLDHIAKILEQYDLVALQEVDAGSLRTGFINQVQYLAKMSGFPHWYLQVNRNLGQIAKHSNAVLSRYRAFDKTNHKLPGMIPGRGAIRLLFGEPQEPLVLVIMHLALGPVARRQQFDYIAELIHGYQNVIVMGDMNCRLEQLIKSSLLKENQLRPVNYLYNTYPSWRPRRNIDHILLSPSVKVNHVEILNLAYSDHLPIALDVTVPGALE